MATEYACSPAPQAGIQRRTGRSLNARSTRSSITHALSAANASGGRKKALQHSGSTLCDAVATSSSLNLRTATDYETRPQGMIRKNCGDAASENHHSALATGAIPTLGPAAG